MKTEGYLEEDHTTKLRAYRRLDRGSATEGGSDQEGTIRRWICSRRDYKTVDLPAEGL